MLHLKTPVRAQEKTKKEINFIGLKRKIYVINMLTMIKMNGILSIINKEAKKMVKCTHEKYKGSRLSAQLGQFYSFEDKSDKSGRSEEHTSELQSRFDLVCRLLLEKKKS